MVGKPLYRELTGKGTAQQQADEAWQNCCDWSSSIVQDIFGGHMQSTLTCPKCHVASFKFDFFMDLSLPVPEPTLTAPNGSKACDLEVCMQQCLQQSVLIDVVTCDNTCYTIAAMCTLSENCLLTRRLAQKSSRHCQ